MCCAGTGPLCMKPSGDLSMCSCTCILGYGVALEADMVAGNEKKMVKTMAMLVNTEEGEFPASGMR